MATPSTARSAGSWRRPRASGTSSSASPAGTFLHMMFGDNQYGLPPENTEGFYNYRVREEHESRAHVVSTRHLDEMVQQLTRLIDKYSALDL